MHYYIGSINKGELSYRENIFPVNADELTLFLANLDPADPETERTVILTTYLTWIKGVLYHSAVAPAPKIKKKGKAKPADKDLDDNDENLDDNMFYRLKSTVPSGIFGRIVLNEAHKVKSVKTRTFRAMPPPPMQN